MGIEESVGFDSHSLSVQGTDNVRLPDDLRKGLDDFWAGRGISLDLLDKHYGLNRRLEIRPTENNLKKCFGY